MGTLWEQGEKTKIPSPLTPSKILKTGPFMKLGLFILSLPNWLHEISLFKTVRHHFSPRLMAGAEYVILCIN
jgi:hypothetical protein